MMILRRARSPVLPEVTDIGRGARWARASQHTGTCQVRTTLNLNAMYACCLLYALFRPSADSDGYSIGRLSGETRGGSARPAPS